MASFRSGYFLFIAALLLAGKAVAATDLWARGNLAAWCIVPFDSKLRGPEERAQMLESLGFTKFAYDWRAEHVPTFVQEVEALKRHHVEMTAWWFPTTMDDNARRILEVIASQHITPQLWIMGKGDPVKSEAEQVARIASETAWLRPAVEAAAKLGLKVGLYNHGGWFGDPLNELAILKQLQAEGFQNVGLVYNFHHGHADIDRFPTLWPAIKPYVLAVTINGMVRDGDKIGKGDLYIGDGDCELAMMRLVQDSGWTGPINIICDRKNIDAAEALQGNLTGLEKVRPLLARPVEK